MTMRSILNDGDRAEIVSRLRALSVSSTGQWGSLDVNGMLQKRRFMICTSASLKPGLRRLP
jgi:hypothetical protein